MNNPVELAIVGAGPAGIEAAIVAAKVGVDVVLIDLARQPGGQYFKQLPAEFQSEDHSKFHLKAEKLYRSLGKAKVNIMTETLVWGAFPGLRPGEWVLALYGPEGSTLLNTRALILATGAYERSIPFPGWDLPGVITAGAALFLIKNQGVLPGKRFVLSGSGPLLLEAAAYLVKAGAEVTGVFESTAGLPWRIAPYLPALWGQWARIGEGLDYIKTLVNSGVPYHTGQAVIEARGDGKVEEVVVARLEKSGKTIQSSEKTLSVDTVVAGYGLVPGTELSRVLGCDSEYIHEFGGFIPVRNEKMQSSLSGVYVVGDGARIGGAENAMIEGRIAGWSAATFLGCLSEQEARQAIAKERADFKKEQRFSRMLADLFTPHPGLYSFADDETIICRCEQVTLRQIREALKIGAQTVVDVKNLTRCGMGNCQGRTCGEIVAHITAAETGQTIEDVRNFISRPPIHPIPLYAIEETKIPPN